MPSLKQLVLGAAAAVSQVAAQGTTTLYSTGGLQILTSNDLEQQLVPDTGAILLSTPRNSSAQAAACAQLGETLWTPESNDFGHSLNGSLYYLQHVGQYSTSQIFHVSGGGDEGWDCRYLSDIGRVNYMDCKQKLPALCTNSAPLSNNEFGDRNETWQVAQTVGGKTMVGWRDQHTFKFQGVRYAEDVGRYQYSVPRNMNATGDEAEDLVDATNYGPHCWQPVGEVTSGMDEDCLFANIWTTYLPFTGTEGKAPRKAVMVNIHGGGFVTGTGANPNFDGTNLASRGDVVVVNLNYRLGNLGYVAFDDGEHTGNYGIGDLVTGLQWIRQNIKYFGGDANQVTIFGESAGAAAVRALMSSEKAKGLFKNAIEQSGPHGWTVGDYEAPEDVAERTTTQIAEEAGCPVGTGQETLECLLQVDPETLVNLNTKASWPVKDGDILTLPSLPLSPNGTAADVNLITGTNRNEIAINIPYPYPDTATTTNVTEWVLSVLANQLSSIDPAEYTPYLSLLPENATLDTAYNLTEHVLNLGTFVCANRATTYSASLHQAVNKIWTYEFTRAYSPFGYTSEWCSAPPTEEFPDGDPNLEYYKCHAAEQLYVWGNVIRSQQPDRDGKDAVLMRVVVDYWTSFARTGDPNPGEAYMYARRYKESREMIEESGAWEPVSVEDPDTLRLMQVPPMTSQFGEGEMCETLGLGMEMFEE